jgi:glycosyltransferase involved in cell wall biosynthesis
MAGSKRPYSVGYFSSYDRGLECLLDMWPRIKELVPKATLSVFYGWNAFDKVHAKNPAMMKWKWQMIRKMNDVGATEHGRVNHQELAEAMKEIQVWAYPTEFTEIHCITALKAQEAGMIPVTTDVAALKETVKSGYQVHASDIYTNEEAQDQFVEFMTSVLKTGRQSKLVDTVFNRYWPDVAKVWDGALS